jgi:hypothetical protein
MLSIKRKKFIELATLSGIAFAATSVSGLPEYFFDSGKRKSPVKKPVELKADVVIADKYGRNSRTNPETFNRDIPIKFFPIKFDKPRLKS